MWRLLRPRFETRLFNKIISSEAIESLLEDWFEIYENDKQKGLEMLVQLSIDISGFESFDVREFIEYNDFTEIVSSIENNRSLLNLETMGFFFLRGNSCKFNACISNISEFIQKIVDLLHETLKLYDCETMDILTNIWNNMSESSLCSLRHTGVFFAVNCNISFLKAQKELQAIIQEFDENLEESLINGKSKEQYAEFFKYVDTHIKQIIDILGKQRIINDGKLNQMKLHCLKAVVEWIEHFPENYLVNFWIDYLIESMYYKTKVIRSLALRAFQSALKKPECEENIKKYLTIYIKDIFERVLDVNLDVSKIAIDILHYIDENYEPLPVAIDEKIRIRVYCFSSVLAIKCGEYFVYTMLKNTSSSEDELRYLARFHLNMKKKVDVEDKAGLLVEAVFNHLPSLKEVPTYLQILQSNSREIDEDFKSALMSIFVEVFMIMCYGHCSILRKDHKKLDVNNEQAIHFVYDVIQHMNRFSKYYTVFNLSQLIILITRFVCEKKLKM